MVKSALTYNRDAVGDQDIGFIGEYEHDAGFGEFEIESQAQIGDLIRGKVDLSVDVWTRSDRVTSVSA